MTDHVKCRWCGEKLDPNDMLPRLHIPGRSEADIEATADYRHQNPATCQVLLLRKIVRLLGSESRPIFEQVFGKPNRRK